MGGLFLRFDRLRKWGNIENKYLSQDENNQPVSVIQINK